MHSMTTQSRWACLIRALVRVSWTPSTINLSLLALLEKSKYQVTVSQQADNIVIRNPKIKPSGVLQQADNTLVTDPILLEKSKYQVYYSKQTIHWSQTPYYRNRAGHQVYYNKQTIHWSQTPYYRNRAGHQVYYNKHTMHQPRTPYSVSLHDCTKKPCIQSVWKPSAASSCSNEKFRIVFLLKTYILSKNVLHKFTWHLKYDKIGLIWTSDSFIKQLKYNSLHKILWLY